MPAPVARGCHGPSNSQLLARFRALPDPDDEDHGVGREGGGQGRRPASEATRKARASGSGCVRPRNYSPVRREGGGTRTVVRGKGDGGRGGAARGGHQENSDEGGGRQKPSGLASLSAMRKPFARRRACRY